MKLFKTVDVVFQLLILFAMAFNYSFREGGGNDAALICLVGFGALQVLSSLIHFFIKFKKTWWRIAYSMVGILILCLLLVIKLDIFSEHDFIEVMIILAPAMGIYYFILSCVETIGLYKKEVGNSLPID